MSNIFQKPKLEIVNFTPWEESGVEVSVLREDLVHPFITGNKYRKLKYNFIDFNNSGKKILLTFGGAFSNHLVAVAASSFENNFNCIGIIRGEEVDNDYISFMRNCGMKIHFVSRTDYRLKSKSEFLTTLGKELIAKGLIHSMKDVFILPEGGSNSAAVRGASEIMNDIPAETDFIACPCGTGATIAGISKSLSETQMAIGVPVLKARDYFEKEITGYEGDLKKIILFSDYHFGGYAKKDKELLNFCSFFTSHTKIPLEHVYSGKLFYAINDQIKKGYFKRGTKVTLVHTGGIFNFSPDKKFLNLSYSFLRNNLII